MGLVRNTSGIAESCLARTTFGRIDFPQGNAEGKRDGGLVGGLRTKSGTIIALKAKGFDGL